MVFLGLFTIINLKFMLAILAVFLIFFFFFLDISVGVVSYAKVIIKRMII